MIIPLKRNIRARASYQGWKHSSVPRALLITLFFYWLDGFVVETSRMCPYEVACWRFMVQFLLTFCWLFSVHKETHWIQEFAFQHWSTKVTICTWCEIQHQRYGQDKVNDLRMFWSILFFNCVHVGEKLGFSSVLCPLDTGWAMLLT